MTPSRRHYQRGEGCGGGFGGCLTLVALAFAAGLMLEAWSSSPTGTRAAMVVVGVVVLGGLWLLGHYAVTHGALGSVPKARKATAGAPTDGHTWSGPYPNGDHWEQRCNCGCGAVRYAS